jgi:hypothetical protein
MVDAPFEAPPRGWLALDGLLTPDPTIAGYRARLQEVRGVCSQGDCRRRCTLDLDRLIRRGFGALAVTQAQQLYRCHNLSGCGLEWSEDRRVGLPVSALFGRAGVRIRFRCSGCGSFRVALPEAVAKRMRGDDPQAAEPLVSDIAGGAKQPCRQCGKRAWRVDVLWPTRDTEASRRRAHMTPR